MVCIGNALTISCESLLLTKTWNIHGLASVNRFNCTQDIRPCLRLWNIGAIPRRAKQEAFRGRQIFRTARIAGNTR